MRRLHLGPVCTAPVLNHCATQNRIFTDKPPRTQRKAPCCSLHPQLFMANSGTESFITRSKCPHPSSLRPLLITKNTDKIYKVLRWQDKNTISSQEVNIGQHFVKYKRKNKINWCRLAAGNEFYLLHHQGQKLLCKQWRTEGCER